VDERTVESVAVASEHKALRRDGSDEATMALVTLAVSLAGAVDDALTGNQPGYVTAKLTRSYAGVLELVCRQMAPPASNTFTDLLERLNTPTLTLPVPEPRYSRPS
jgi:hypothetical protein